MKRIPRAAGVMFALICLARATACSAYDGRLVDQITGQPVPGVWVMGHWEGGGGFVISSGGCTLAITRTNDKGEFSLNTSGFFGRLFGGDPRPAIYFFKPGHREVGVPALQKHLHFLGPETGNSLERMTRLEQIVLQSDCGLKYSTDHKSELKPFISEIAAEAERVAVTYPEKQRLVTIRRALDVLELGYEIAAAKAKASADANTNEFLKEAK